jgi:hypothetical protein
VRRHLSVGLAALIALAFAAPAHAAEEPIEIFDAHLHYNFEPTPTFQPDEVLALLKKHRVTGILSTSRPNTGTHVLMSAKAGGKAGDLQVVPFIRPYRTRPDIQTWFNDPVIFDLVQDEFKRGYYRGVGEFHLHGKSADTEMVKKTVDFAVEHNLYLHAHSDAEAGSDSWVPQRWLSYGDTMEGYRAWLAQLSPAIARQIAHGNARALFAEK